VEMRNIASVEQPRRAGSTDIGGHNPDDLNPVSSRRMDNRPPADAMNSNAVDEVGMLLPLMGTNDSTKETQSCGCDGREPHPSDLRADSKDAVAWEQWYRHLWQVKLSASDENDG